MATTTIEELLLAASEIRDADTEQVNTALRVGTLFVKLIQYASQFMTETQVNDILQQVSDGLEELLTGYAKLNSDETVLDWTQSPIVFLDSMGEAFDTVNGASYDYTPAVGDLYYYEHSGFQVFWKTDNSPATGYRATVGVVYVNKKTLRAYVWDGSSMSELGESYTSKIQISKMDQTDMSSIPVGKVHFMPASSKLVYRISNSKTFSWTPRTNLIYVDVSSNTLYRWQGSSFQKTSSSVKVINDMTTGGEEDAFSAEMGKTVNEKIEELKASLARAMLTAMELPENPIAGCTYYDPTASINARIKMYYLENNTLKHIDTAPSDQMIYCDMSSNTTYRFDGLGMVQIGGDSGGGISYTEDSTTIYVTSAGHVDPTPRISVSPTEISLSPAVGGTMTKTIIVRGYNLSQGITIALTDASGFYSVNTQSLPAGGGNIVLTYHPTSAGTHNASLNISSGDASAAVSIVGVAASPTINVSSQSLSMRGASGSAVTASFRVTGVSLADDINVAVSGSGFSASPSVITAQQAVDGVDVAVTFDGSASTGSGTITLSSTGATSVQVAVTYAAIERLQEGDTITSYIGMVFTVLSDRQSVSVKGSGASGAIVIPSVVQDENGLAYDVTELDFEAFRGMGITSVEIPASVTSWKTNSNGYANTFYGCSSLTSAIIRSKCAIGSSAFYNCTSLRSVQIDEGVTSIGGGAFNNCPFESLVIPDSVTSSGPGAFGGSGLKYLQIGTSTACAFRSLYNSLYNGTAGAMSLQYIVLYSTSIPTANLGAQKLYGASLPPHYRNYDSTNEAKGTNYDTNGTGRLYVPNSVLTAYRTNVKDYTGAADIDKSRNIFKDLNDINDATGASGRIYAIEDIGTISGYENDALLTD